MLTCKNNCFVIILKMVKAKRRHLFRWRKKSDESVGRHLDKVSCGGGGMVAFVSWERREREEEPTSVNTATILSHPPSRSQATPQVR